MSPRFFALVPCAGVGSRAGTTGPKQYVPIAGRAMVAHTVQALSQVTRLHATLVVLAPDDAGTFERQVPEFDEKRGWLSHVGGATRAETVAAGLTVLAERGARDADWVLVHDAARCLIRPAWVDALIDACHMDAVGGLLALPLADTMKQAREGRIVTTLDRTDKWAAQTPQMFRLGLLRRALAQAGPGVTDEASAVEALGLAPRLVPGPLENFKVTWAADFDAASRLLGGIAGPESAP